MPPLRTTPPATPPSQPLEVIDPRWLLKAVGITILAALCCGYATLSLLLYQGQWQLILHPQITTRPLQSLAGVPVTPLRFGAAESGVPRLVGAFLRADAGSRYAGFTVLYLRGGDASLGQSLADERNLTTLHTLGLTVFAFDYRGYGQSEAIHPSQARMSEDAADAFRFLAETRSIPEEHLIVFGNGVGASLALGLADAHARIPALILDSPGPAPLSIALADPRTRSLPVRALFHEDFPLTSLHTLTRPKLLISGTTETETFQTAAEPKMTIYLPAADASALAAGLSRFLDMYLQISAPAIIPR